MSCKLNYIPNHLHVNGRPDIPEFWLGEFLYRRCKEEEKENPFKNISPIDLSVNRSGSPEELLSHKEDVLFNINPETAGKPEKFDMAIATLQIRELTEEKTYTKTEIHEKNINGAGPEKEIHSCAILLKHKKEECNYAHSAFEVYFDDIFLTYGNYKQLLGKHTPLRTWCKNELAKMIVKEEVRINWDN